MTIEGLLASSDATLEALAEELGFSSGFHLSSAFKRAYGISPEHWRRQLARAMPSERERQQLGATSASEAAGETDV